MLSKDIWKGPWKIQGAIEGSQVEEGQGPLVEKKLPVWGLFRRQFQEYTYYIYTHKIYIILLSFNPPEQCF